MEKTKIRLVTAWKAYLSFFIWFSLFIGMLVFNAHVLHGPPFLFILAGVLPLLFPIRLMKHIPGISNVEEIALDQEEGNLLITGKHFPIGDLQWYRLDFNSPLLHQLVLKFKNGQRIRLAVWADGSGHEKKLWKLYEQIKTTTLSPNLAAKDYYDRPSLRVISWIVLGAVPALWTLPLLMPNSNTQLISGLAVWTGTALSFFAVVRHASHKSRNPES